MAHYKNVMGSKPWAWLPAGITCLAMLCMALLVGVGLLERRVFEGDYRSEVQGAMKRFILSA